jgi:DNA topoisomerase I
MTKKLLIVESPSKAKTIKKYLGPDFDVLASVGHVRDLPKSNKKAIDIEGGFIPHYEISKGKEKVIREIKSKTKDVKEIYLATDPDREGEAIAWHLAEILKLKNPQRVTFNEITKEAVNEAVKNPREIDQRLRQAQEARRVLDRLVGYDLSGLIWKKVRYGLSAGRVQSPALRIIMEREREIRAFIPEEYFVITANLKSVKDEILFTCEKELRDKKLADEIIEKGKNGKWFVRDIKETEAKRSPRPPFTTSTLQQTASTRLGFSPSRTMQIAQKLYEAGLITYMRTDSPTLSKQALAQSAVVIEKIFGKSLVSIKNFQSKSKSAQEAHEAIRPTDLGKRSAGLSPEQKKLYELIWSRTIASQMSDAKVARTKILANIRDESIPDFSVNGQRVIFEGWLMADPRARGEDVELPKIEKGSDLGLISINRHDKHTEPPNRYTEAGLIKELEKRGIGRPSTYASIMKTLAERGYVEKQGKTLIPTDTGDVVSSFLEQNFTKYISDSFTAEMENELDEIALGKREYTKTLKEFYTPFTKDLKEKENVAKLTTLGQADEKHKCPKCGASMDIKLSKIGKFLSCSKYPECDGALTIDGQEIKTDEPIGIHPETGENIFVKVGRFGPYVQLGELIKGKKDPNTGKAFKPKMASIPKEKDLTDVSLQDALKYLSIPRTLGNFPGTDLFVTANNGRFGPYVACDGKFASIKPPLNVYDINLDQAVTLLKNKKTRKKK